MRPDDLTNELRKQPFTPFRVVMTDGKSYDIFHPELLMVGHRSATIGLTESPEERLYNLTALLDLMHIIRVEPLPQKASGKNGKKKH
jgi:hypothetical protein